jgi:hypothetical protein
MYVQIDPDCETLALWAQSVRANPSSPKELLEALSSGAPVSFPAREVLDCARWCGTHVGWIAAETPWAPHPLRFLKSLPLEMRIEKPAGPGAPSLDPAGAAMVVAALHNEAARFFSLASETIHEDGSAFFRQEAERRTKQAEAVLENMRRP